MLTVNYVGRSKNEISWFLVHGQKHGNIYRRHYGLVNRDDKLKIVDAEHRALPVWELDSIQPLIEAAMTIHTRYNF